MDNDLVLLPGCDLLIVSISSVIIVSGVIVDNSFSSGVIVDNSFSSGVIIDNSFSSGIVMDNSFFSVVICCILCLVLEE